MGVSYDITWLLVGGGLFHVGIQESLITLMLSTTFCLGTEELRTHIVFHPCWPVSSKDTNIAITMDIGVPILVVGGRIRCWESRWRWRGESGRRPSRWLAWRIRGRCSGRHSGFIRRWLGGIRHLIGGNIVYTQVHIATIMFGTTCLQ